MHGMTIGCICAYDKSMHTMEGKTKITDIIIPPVVGTIVGGCVGEFVGIAICRQTLKSTMKLHTILNILVFSSDYVSTKYFGRQSFFVN